MTPSVLNEDVEIRRAGAADAEGIVRLTQRVAADAPFYLAYDIDPASGAEVLQAKLAGDEGGDAIIVAALQETIVGAALLRRHMHPAFAGVLQFALSVDPSWRRRGLGAGLTQAALDAAREAGARRVQLAVVDDNAGARRLFERAGFVVEGRLRAAAEIGGARHDVVAMACLL
mgnify:CR=1 FL=1